MGNILYVYIAKASEIDHKKREVIIKLTISKGIETFQMSYFSYMQCCNDVKK